MYSSTLIRIDNRCGVQQYFDVSRHHASIYIYLQVDSFPDAVEVRAVIEGQCMSRRVHAENLGFGIGITPFVLFLLLLLSLFT